MPVMKGDAMRGLAVFISDIRNCKSKEAEIKRINKELANVRSKFKGDKTLDGYQKKKYVCKLLFIFLLGHDIDFGHMEAVNLLSSNKYTEKQIGYLFISVLIGASNDLMKLVIQAIKNDLQSRNPIHVCLALHCVANIGSREMAEGLGTEIPKLIVSGDSIDSVKQSAALCLLRLLYAAPDAIPLGDWCSRCIHLINDQHMGVSTSAVSLIEMLVKKTPDDLKGCVSIAVARLSRIVTSSYTDLQDYTYYFVPAPWLSVKLLRLLQNYPPPEEPSVRTRLVECLEAILNKAQEPPKSKKVQHSNAKNAVLFEAINLIIHMDNDPQLLVRACNQLGQFLQHRETNLRYLALESMCLLATSEFSHEAVKKHQETVILALKTERDVSVRQRAVDLLYAMCDRTNAEEIVSEMLSYLETADYSIREEMVLKVAILAEKYAVDYTWYVDTILNLIRIAGDYVSEEVWYRVIQIVINREDVQGYAAKTVFEALQAPACHENMVKVGGYILGEFGNLIAGDTRSSSMVQFELLHSKFPLCSTSTKAILLSTYMKYINLFPEIKPHIQQILQIDSQLRSNDIELQQRSVEYLRLSNIASPDVLATVLEEMPPFPEKESSILKEILKKKKPASMQPENKTTKPSRPTAQVNSTGGGVEAGGIGAPPAPAAAVTNGPSKQAEEVKVTNEPAVANDLLNLDQSFGSTPTQPSQTPASLGLVQTSAPVSATAAPASSGLLVDVFDNPTPVVSASESGAGDTTLSVGAEENFKSFICKNNGVLFESDIIQVGVKAEFRQNLGRIGIFYGNKTSFSLRNFTVQVVTPDELNNQLSIQPKPVASMVESGAQVQQMINIECLDAFTEVPLLHLQFLYNNVPQRISMKLPVMVSKFVESIDMEGPIFFARWKQLGLPQQESQLIFQAKFPIANDQIRIKLTGFGISHIENIDPNKENFVCAGIVHTKQGQIGVLVRLEPNQSAAMYRLTVRTSRETVSKRLAALLQTLF